MPFSEALSVEAVFVFPMLKGVSKSKIQAIEQGEIFYKTTKPDLTDNLMKGTMDALNGIVFTDDSIIAKVDSIKIYGVVPKIHTNGKLTGANRVSEDKKRRKARYFKLKKAVESIRA